jgi:hypothetical protein
VAGILEMPVVTLLLTLLAGAGTSPSSETGPPSRVSIEAFQEGYGTAWFLKLETTGKMTVQVGGSEHTRKLDDVAMAQLAEVARNEAIFDLADTYGEALFDLPWRTARIWQGGRVKTLTLHAGLATEPRQAEVKRALRFWLAVRGLFEAEGAADSRAEDRRLVDK